MGTVCTPGRAVQEVGCACLRKGAMGITGSVGTLWRVSWDQACPRKGSEELIPHPRGCACTKKGVTRNGEVLGDAWEGCHRVWGALRSGYDSGRALQDKGITGACGCSRKDVAGSRTSRVLWRMRWLLSTLEGSRVGRGTGSFLPWVPRDLPHPRRVPLGSGIPGKLWHGSMWCFVLLMAVVGL